MRIRIILILAATLMIAGCSYGNTITPENDIADADSYSSIGLLGSYELIIDIENKSAELIPHRNSSIGESYLVSGMGFFTFEPCADCLNIENISYVPPDDPSDPDALWQFILNFGIRHPFKPGDPEAPPSAINRLDLDVFDVALVILPTEVDPVAYTLTGANMYGGYVENAAGYTVELAQMLANDAALPYCLVVNDAIDQDPPYSTWNEFYMGASRDFDVVFSLQKGSGVTFDTYLTMGYGASAKKSQRLNPTYYNPEFNRKPAWFVDVAEPIPVWMSNDAMTTHDLIVNVYDWQITSNVDINLKEPTDVYAASSIADITVEIPGMTAELVRPNPGWSGDGMPGTPVCFTFSIANENLLPAGEYTGLIAVRDQREVGAIGIRDYLIHTADGTVLLDYNIPEYVTFQTFTAVVQSP